MTAYPVELFANKVSTTVTSGGTDAPSAGTSQTFTVSTSTNWPAADSSTPSQFRIVDQADTHSPPEIMIVTNVSGTTWTVTRGAEGPQVPYAHAADWTAVPVLTAGALAAAPSATGSPVVRAFPFDHTTADLGSGVTLFTPVVGEILLDAWFENDTGWVGPTGVGGGYFIPAGDIGTFDGSDYGLFSDVLQTGIGVPLTEDLAINGTGLQTPTTGTLASAWQQGANPGAPAKFTAADPLLLVVSQDGSTATATAATLDANSAPSLPLVVSSGVQDSFGIANEATGGPLYFTVTPGTYTTVAEVATAMAAAVDGASNPLSDYIGIAASGSKLLATSVIDGGYGNYYYFESGSTDTNDFLAPSGFEGGANHQFQGGYGGTADATAGSSVLYIVTVSPLT